MANQAQGFRLRPEIAAVYRRPDDPDYDDAALSGLIGELRSRYAPEQQAADAAALAGVAKGREQAAQQDFLTGMALSSVSGQDLAPVGRQLTKEALERGAPLRPNEADVGYYNPTTGEYVANPANIGKQKQKEIEFEIARLDRRAKHASTLAGRRHINELLNERVMEKARLEAATRLQIAANRPARQEALVQTQDEEGNITYTPRSQAAGMRPPPKGGTNLQLGEKDRLLEFSSNLDTARDIRATFKDEYAGGGSAGRVDTWVNQQAGSLGTKGMQADAEWWAKFRMLQELPQRHAQFGATLTASEKQSWSNAQRINPGNDPKIVKKAMDEMITIYEKKYGDFAGQLRAEGKTVEIRPAPAPTGRPAVGTVEGGYRFKGGDPSKPENWEKQ